MRRQEIFCASCNGTIRECICPNALRPEEKPIEKCPDCPGWRKLVYCDCEMPSPTTSEDGKLKCGTCQRKIQACTCPDSVLPYERPIQRCHGCGGWRKYIEKKPGVIVIKKPPNIVYCRCSVPRPYAKNGSVMCHKCDGLVKVCTCKGAELPLGGKIDKCQRCLGWKKEAKNTPETNKIEVNIYIDIDINIDIDIEYILKIYGPEKGQPVWYWGWLFDELYFIKDYIYFLKYAFTNYRGKCDGPVPKTVREIYENAFISILDGTFPARNKDEKEGARSLYILSFVGLRYMYYCGNTMGVSKTKEYFPIAFRFPFIGQQNLVWLSRNPSQLDAEIHTAVAGESNKKNNRLLEWKGDFTYFPEPNDDQAKEAKKFAYIFMNVLYAKNDNSQRSLMVRNSPEYDKTVSELRKMLPSNMLLGRALYIGTGTYVVPCLVKRNNMIYAYRMVVVKVRDKMYLFKIITP